MLLIIEKKKKKKKRTRTNPENNWNTIKCSLFFSYLFIHNTNYSQKVGLFLNIYIYI